MLDRFPTIRQANEMDCGPTCLRIVLLHYKVWSRLDDIRRLCNTSRDGTTMLNLRRAAEEVGFHAYGVAVDYDTMLNEIHLPIILHWMDTHFVVVYKIKRNRVYISDPSRGLVHYSKEEFKKKCMNVEGLCSVLVLEPTSSIQNYHTEKKNIVTTLSLLKKYVRDHKKLLFQLVIGLVASLFFQTLFPFLTQSIIDVGIKNKDINFVLVILTLQLFFLFSRFAIEAIRKWILLHLSSKINISMLSGFFIKLMNLPLSYYDSRKTGDTLQRVNDNYRIQNLVTLNALNTFFAAISLLVLGSVLLYYSAVIFTVFFIGTFFYAIWIIFFLKKRENIDYERFGVAVQDQSKIIEILNGMQELKLHNAETKKRWEWEEIQNELYKVNLKSLRLEQSLNLGSSLINEVKNIFITCIAAYFVIIGNISLGAMLAIVSLIGQMGGPILQLLTFITAFQDTKISLNRLNEVYEIEDEEQGVSNSYEIIDGRSDISLKNLSFKYFGANDYTLKNISFEIPNKKVTAIVGSSGSGKSTLIKLLLNFYNDYEGDILVNNVSLIKINKKWWRDKSSAVLQDGFIFNDTLLNNITIGGDGKLDRIKLAKALDFSNVLDFVGGGEIKLSTKIGSEGINLSAGQKQRLLIARSVYKDPSFLILDEATSSLDSTNEREILSNLKTFFKDRTVLIVAHRLSTIKDADQIIVLDKGRIVEIGNHNELIAQSNYYYKLVKNQLNL